MPPVLTFPLRFVAGQSPVRKYAEVELELRTRSGLWKSVAFRVDTGANLSSMSLRMAEARTVVNPDGLDLATLFQPRPVERQLADGSKQLVAMQLGTLTARFAALRSFVFRWECLFDPTVLPTAPPLLGLGGRVLTDVHITLRGATHEHPTGTVAFELLVPPVPLFPSSELLVRECHREPAGWPVPTDPE